MTDVIEREIKIKLDIDPSQLVRNLEKEGFEYLGEEEQEDVYLNGTVKDFRDTDEALRIRVVNDKVELTYKSPKMGKDSKSREEITVNLDNKESMIKILEKLGYKSSYVLRKRRISFRKGNFTVCVDNVEGLGNFIEIEGIDVKESDLVSFFQDFKGKFHLNGEPITKSYLELMVNKLDNSNPN
ncbi:MAG: class IV adenylate cyclase [Metallosphaera sp.]|uniref:Adenylate cyclase n=1 Tax=Metallosphaera cuprina (strain Ar-4) TaxID=1006006 RepID=F4G3B9_METCR|nr:class IV adenylate cyclase [Metallosphaera cuprina]AEB94117.1 adenylate cyclase [Metallosphaera cuprina Ar-4]